MNLSASDQAMLFRVARDEHQGPSPRRNSRLAHGRFSGLSQPSGVFVTLHLNGRLRGCIGYLEATKPLLAAVQDMAIAAAFNDPRFPPLRQEELARLDLQISVLSPMSQIKKIEEIEVGRDGIYLEQGPYRGLLLPQVATESRWDRLTFLKQTSVKAGLPPDSSENPARASLIFSAKILHEPPKK